MAHYNKLDRPLESTLKVKFQDNPFDEISTEAKSQIVKEIATNSKTAYVDSLNYLIENILKTVEPRHTLAHLGFYDQLFIPSLLRDHPEKSEEMGIIPLDQCHIEFLQALILRMNPSDLVQSSPQNYNEIFNEIREKLRDIFFHWSMSLLDQVQQNNSCPHIIEHFRGRTAIIRNWGHTKQVLKWLSELFARHDRDLCEIYSISFTDLIQYVSNVYDVTIDRINQRKIRIQPAMMANTVDEVIEAFITAFNCESSERESLLKLNLDAENLKYLLLFHYDLTCHEIFTFNAEDISKENDDLINQNLARILSNWTTTHEEIAKMPIDHLLMSNPVSQKPLIAVENGRFFWPLIFIFQSFGLHLLESLLPEGIRIDFSVKTLPEFCEDKTIKLLKEHFPQATIYKNVTYTDNGREYECDCILIFDVFYLVVEVKSGRLRASAHRGGTESIKRGLEDLISDGSKQALRTIDAIKKRVSFKDADGRMIYFPECDRDIYIPIVLTFEHFGELATKKCEAISSGILPELTKDCICMPLAEFEIVLEILPSVSQRLHYLKRRISIEQNFKFRGDEIDLLTFYLKTGFAICEAEYKQKEIIVISGLSTEIDPYLLRGETFEPRPCRYISSMWNELQCEFERRNFKGWTLLSCMLLDHDREAMDTVELQFPELMKEATSNKSSNDKQDVLILTTTQSPQCNTIIFIAGNRLTKEVRNMRIQQAVNTLPKVTETKSILAIYFDSSLSHTPYHSAYMLDLYPEKEN